MRKNTIMNSVPTGQCHENDLARMVIVSTPGLHKLMGSLHPAGSLYEKPVNLRDAHEQHSTFRSVLSANGVEVYEVERILAMEVESNVRYRIELEDLASQCLTYQLGESVKTDAAEEYKSFIADEYKRVVLKAMSTEQLTDIIQTNPTVTLEPSFRDTGLKATYSFDPLTNLVFCRDQQITTIKGIVMARLQSTQRDSEVDIMEYCLRKLGLNVIGRIPEPAYLEGGDFFPLGKELCMIGIGLRSNFAACKYLMDNDLLGTDKVAVVRDDLERVQDRMHLDTVFNILSNNCCLMYEPMMGNESPVARFVDEYARADENSPYTLVREKVEFTQYVTELGFHVIPVTPEEQAGYGCNVLNLGSGNIIAVNESVARKIARSQQFEGAVRHIEFDAIMAMYGAVHCATQVVYRSQT